MKITKNKYTGIERRSRERRNSVQSAGRRSDECAAHSLLIEQARSQGIRIGASEVKFDTYVTWKMISLILGFSILVVASGFKYFSDDLTKTKDSQVEMIRQAANQSEKTSFIISAIQKEIALALSENQRENRIQFERFSVQAENMAKIQAVIMSEIADIKKRNDRIDDKRRP